MSEILSNTGVKLWAETDYSELWLTVFDQLTGQGGKSNIRLIDEAIGKINDTLDGYKFEFSSDEDRLYISKGDSKLPVSLIDSNGHVASKVDGTTITIDESGVVRGIPVDDALSEISTNPLQNKVIAGELKSIKSKIGTDESTIKSNTKRIEANETAISTLNGTGDGSVKKAVSDGIAKVVAGAPEDFDTLKEMSDWISTHETSASAMNSAIKDNKSAITALQIGKADKTEIPTVPTNVSEFINDAGYLTEHQDISNLVVKEEGKGLSSNNYTSEEKTKLGGVGTSQGRNLIPYPLTDRTTNGITYTVQSDGSVLANGTASAENNAYYNFAYKTLKLGDTSYTLSCEGLPKSVYVYVYDETISKAVVNVSDTPVTKTFVGNSTHTYSLSINVGKGTSVSDLAIKPILEIGTIAHTYEPISESNVNLKDAIDKISTSQGKNIIPYPYSQTTKTVYGVTFTDNKDGSIGISGTQDGSTSRPYMGVGIWWGTDKKEGNIKIDANTYFTISANCSSDNAGIRYYVYDESGSKLADNIVYGTATKTLKFDVDTWVALCIETAANSETYDCICKPQLELGTIAHAYEPSIESNVNLKKEIDKTSTLQGQNLIPYPYDGTEGNTNGITWTVNDDGSVTANGTASKEAPYSLIYPYNLSTMKSLQLGNTYIISDGLTDEQHTNVGYMQLVRYDKNNPTNWKYGVSSMKGTEIYTANDENTLQYGIRLIIRNGATANNITFKPMLEVGTMSHEYQPTTLSNPTLKKEIGSALQPESIVNNQTTTVAGFALDARQANPNIDGTLAKQLSDLNGSLNSKKIPSFGIENIFTGNPFCIVNNGSDVISVQTDWDIDNGGYRVKNIKYPAGTATNLTVSLSLPANSIVIVDVNSLNGENIDIQGSLIRCNLSNSASVWNLSIRFTGRTSQTLSDIRYMPLVIHLG